MQSLVSGLFAPRILFAAADGTAQSGVSPPCKSGSCLFAGQSELVGGNHVLSCVKYYHDPRCPKWTIDDILTAPRSVLSYLMPTRGKSQVHAARGRDRIDPGRTGT